MKINNEQEKQQAIARARELSSGTVQIDLRISECKDTITATKAKIQKLNEEIATANKEIKTLTTQKATEAKTNAKELAEIKSALADYAIAAS